MGKTKGVEGGGEEVNCGEAWRAWSGVISLTIVDLHSTSSTIANTSVNTNTNTNTNTATIDKIKMQNTRVVVRCYFCDNRALPHIVFLASSSAKKQCKQNTGTIYEYKYNSAIVLLLFTSTEWQKLKHKTRSWRGVISVTMPSSQTTERPTLHASPEIRPLIAAASAARDKVSLNICKDVPSRRCKFFKCEIVVKTMERGGGRKFSGLLFRTFYCFYTLLRAIN